MRDWDSAEWLLIGTCVGLPALGMVLYAIYRIAELFA